MYWKKRAGKLSPKNTMSGFTSPSVHNMPLSETQEEEQEQEEQDWKQKSKAEKEEQQQEEACAGVVSIVTAQKQAWQLFEGRAIWALEALPSSLQPCLKHWRHARAAPC